MREFYKFSILKEHYIYRELEKGNTAHQVRRQFKPTSPNPINCVSGDQSQPDLEDYKIPGLNEYMDVLVSMSSNPLNFTVSFWVLCLC